MENIKIIEKPESITYDEIRNLIYLAHGSNRENGVVVSTTKLDSDGIRDYLGKDGKCYVALLGDKLVGTSSYRILNIKRWYHDGPALDKVLTAVAPEYKGMHISSLLHKEIMDDAVNNKYKIVTMDTQEANDTMRSIAEKRGFKYVDYYRSKRNTRHYCVKMAKWIEEQPFSDKYLNRRFKVKKCYTKIREWFKRS